MKLHALPKITKPKNKRLGRGYGSGKGGHTSSRGQKGQNSRGSVPAWFEGGQLPFIRRLPFIKGKNRFKSLHSVVVTVNVGDLEKMTAKVITAAELVKAGIIKTNAAGATIKILGRGKLAKSLKVMLPTSVNAENKIVKAGGTVEKD